MKFHIMNEFSHITSEYDYELLHTKQERVSSIHVEIQIEIQLKCNNRITATARDLSHGS